MSVCVCVCVCVRARARAQSLRVSDSLWLMDCSLPGPLSMEFSMK